MNLAEKYRPTSLDEVVGQKVVVTNIKKILGRKDVPKTWMFYGPSGCGKTTIAKILASHFTNGHTSPTNLILIDAAVETGAEDMRKATIRANYRAIGECQTKVHLVDEFHNLSQKAFDALLLSTEEPPPHVFWLFCTTNPGKVPETIKTRCVSIALKPVPETLIFELLVKVSESEKLNTLPEVLELLAENCKGSPRQALSDLEKCAGAASLGEARELLRSAAQLKEPVDLARFLLSRHTGKWSDAVAIIDTLRSVEAESVRIVITNYMAGALMKAKSNDDAKRILFLLECFSQGYNQSDKLGPLLLSVAAAMGLDQ